MVVNSLPGVLGTMRFSSEQIEWSTRIYTENKAGYGMSRSKRISALAAAAVASVVMSAGVIASASSGSTDGDSRGSGNSSKPVEVTTYKLTRYEIDTKQDYDTFVSAFEQAVPTFNPAIIFAGVSSWADVVANTAAVATNGFLIYTKFTGWPWAGISGNAGLDDRRGAMYLMGNHVIAETMYRHNPGVMLHAPLRLMIFENERGDAVFEIERPSDQFGAYGDKRIAEVGLLLNHKVAQLLTVLEVPVPAGLAR